MIIFLNFSSIVFIQHLYSLFPDFFRIKCTIFPILSLILQKNCDVNIFNILKDLKDSITCLKNPTPVSANIHY